LIEYFFQCCYVADSTAKCVFLINAGSLLEHCRTNFTPLFGIVGITGGDNSVQELSRRQNFTLSQHFEFFAFSREHDLTIVLFYLPTSLL
jgi:hypothetical protein